MIPRRLSRLALLVALALGVLPAPAPAQQPVTRPKPARPAPKAKAAPKAAPAANAAPIAVPAPVRESPVRSVAAKLPADYKPEFGTMWTFEAPPLAYWKARYDFTPDQAWLDHVRLASIRLPGCSSSFVSAQGLVMTNHHCARACISAVSPADTNYQTVGFVARTLQEEKKCPGLYVDQLQSIEDVTARLRGRVTAKTPAEQVAQRDAEIERIQNECQQQTRLTCQVVTFYQGGMYSLYRYRRYDDVRLVMAPEEAISFFGGDPDNFTYPRYDLDVTLLRVYENDQPFRPKDYLKWSAAGAKDGELVLVTGNPGSTGRLLTLAQMEYLRDVQYPAQLATLARNIRIYQGLMARSPALQRQYENANFGAQNSFKAITGYRAGLLDTAIMGTKQAFERDFRARIAADPRLRAQYGGAWDAIAGAERELTRMARQTRYYGLNGSTLTSLAGALVLLPREAALPDSARLPSWRGDGLQKIRAQLTGDVPVDTTLERLQLAAWLTEARRDLGAADPLVQAFLEGRAPEDAAAALVAGTKLGDPAVRRQLVEGGAGAVAASTDPLVVAARSVAPRTLDVAQRAARQQAIISANAEKVGQAIFAAYGKTLPPDATFTLRITDGVVAGFPYNGTRAPYKTTYYGMFGHSAAFDDVPPYQLPQRWRAHVQALDLATPLDFVTTNDIIGGNSGSPVINRNAEIVGLIFDGNIESLPNRFIFTDEVARSVAVHSRAIPEALRKVYEAPRLADELEGR
ncbi:MAG TPA: S46 family peptidase [Gemmatimonadales bacterium]|nr:S46 family peptidase [Gemmatimonadales bacterium]